MNQNGNGNNQVLGREGILGQYHIAMLGFMGF